MFPTGFPSAPATYVFGHPALYGKDREHYTLGPATSVGMGCFHPDRLRSVPRDLTLDGGNSAVTGEGFEPPTTGLKGPVLYQLSYPVITDDR